MSVVTIQKEMKRLASAKKAKLLAGFFKTGQGQYGAGDIFLGVMVPQTRSVAKKYYQTTNLDDIQKLIASPYHEMRLLGLIMLNLRYGKTDEKKRGAIYNFYLKNTKRINNWDLVDLSAPNIVGNYLLYLPSSVLPSKRGGEMQANNNISPSLRGRTRGGDGAQKILYKLARSKNLWERRIAIIATAAFIRAGEFADTLKIADILLADTHDLIHKAVGWMLREVGKKDTAVLVKYLKPRYKKMPRTMLRYAIEKFPENRRKQYLKK